MKSERIPFRVAEATGWEEGYPAKDLELHSPWVKGWRAPRYCLFPQEVVLSLPNVMKLGTLQILSHQHLIASKVELLVGQAREGRAAVLPNASFSRLGYVTFGDNQSSSYRTRELKSIPLDVTCQFIKIRFHQNHINHLNPFNQVGVVAVNVIGEPANISCQQEPGLSKDQPSRESRDVNKVVHSYLPGYHSNQSAKSAVPATDDLAFTMYQDPETGGLIRHLQQQKEVAVRGEDFSRAKLLKQAIVDLQKVGEALAQFAVEKQRAVETENYEAAEECKERADRLRVHMYHQLNVFGLVADTSVLGRHAVTLPPTPTTAGSESPWPQETGGRPLRPHPLHDEANDEPDVIPVQSSRLGVVPVVVSSEERPLPTLANKVGVTAAAPREEEGAIPVPDKLSESALNEATLPIQVFGMELVECVYAKQFAHRERALRDLSASLSALSTGSPRKDVAATAKAISILLRRLLADKMAVGFQTACTLLVTLFDSVGQKLKKHFSSADIDALVSKTFPVLLGRLGDSAPRVVQQATETIVQVLKSNDLEDLPTVADQLTEPLGKQAAWRVLLGRVILLRQVVTRGGVKGHLMAGKVMRVVRPGLEHPNGQVRDAAVQLALDLYPESPAEVRRGLPVDTPTLRKSLLWRTVMEGLDQIDGKPTSRQLKEAEQEQERARADELAEVQKELSGLRQLADQVAATSKTLSSGTQKEVRFRGPSGPSPSQDRGQEEEEHACTFCGTTGSEFAEEAQLNRHYFKYCVMLYQCSHCTQMVEIPALHEHWLTECKGKGKFRKCPRCKEAVLATQYPSHIAAKTCKVPSGNRRRCPLCQMSVVSDEEGWRGHLMGGKPCKNNPRKPQKHGQLLATYTTGPAHS